MARQRRAGGCWAAGLAAAVLCGLTGHALAHGRNPVQPARLLELQALSEAEQALLDRQRELLAWYLHAAEVFRTSVKGPRASCVMRGLDLALGPRMWDTGWDAALPGGAGSGSHVDLAGVERAVRGRIDPRVRDGIGPPWGHGPHYLRFERGGSPGVKPRGLAGWYLGFPANTPHAGGGTADSDPWHEMFHILLGAHDLSRLVDVSHAGFGPSLAVAGPFGLRTTHGSAGEDREHVFVYYALELYLWLDALRAFEADARAAWAAQEVIAREGFRQTGLAIEKHVWYAAAQRWRQLWSVPHPSSPADDRGAKTMMPLTPALRAWLFANLNVGLPVQSPKPTPDHEADLVREYYMSGRFTTDPADSGRADRRGRAIRVPEWVMREPGIRTRLVRIAHEPVAPVARVVPPAPASGAPARVRWSFRVRVVDQYRGRGSVIQSAVENPVARGRLTVYVDHPRERQPVGYRLRVRPIGSRIRGVAVPGGELADIGDVALAHGVTFDLWRLYGEETGHVYPAPEFFRALAGVVPLWFEVEFELDDPDALDGDRLFRLGVRYADGLGAKEDPGSMLEMYDDAAAIFVLRARGSAGAAAVAAVPPAPPAAVVGRGAGEWVLTKTEPHESVPGGGPAWAATGAGDASSFRGKSREVAATRHGPNLGRIHAYRHAWTDPPAFLPDGGTVALRYSVEDAGCGPGQADRFESYGFTVMGAGPWPTTSLVDHPNAAVARVAFPPVGGGPATPAVQRELELRAPSGARAVARGVAEPKWSVWVYAQNPAGSRQIRWEYTFVPGAARGGPPVAPGAPGDRPDSADAPDRPVADGAREPAPEAEEDSRIDNESDISEEKTEMPPPVSQAVGWYTHPSLQWRVRLRGNWRIEERAPGTDQDTLRSPGDGYRLVIMRGLAPYRGDVDAALVGLPMEAVSEPFDLGPTRAVRLDRAGTVEPCFAFGCRGMLFRFDVAGTAAPEAALRVMAGVEFLGPDAR